MAGGCNLLLVFGIIAKIVSLLILFLFRTDCLQYEAGGLFGTSKRLVETPDRADRYVPEPYYVTRRSSDSRKSASGGS